MAVLFWRQSSTASDSMRALCSYLDAALYWVISDTYRSQLHEKKWTFLWGTPHFHHRPIETTTLRKWAWFGWRKCCLWALVDAWGTYYCYDDHSIYNCVLVCFGYRNEHSFIKISTQCWCWLVTILKYFDEGLLVDSQVLGETVFVDTSQKSTLNQGMQCPK